MKECKRCLLLEAGENKSFETISDYILNLSEDLKVNNDIYRKRLDICKQCDYLISGMCLKCGCYVEVRAVLKDKVCPNYDNRKW
jgi:hypothetical protein